MNNLKSIICFFLGHDWKYQKLKEPHSEATWFFPIYCRRCGKK